MVVVVVNGYPIQSIVESCQILQFQDIVLVPSQDMVKNNFQLIFSLVKLMSGNGFKVKIGGNLEIAELPAVKYVFVANKVSDLDLSVILKKDLKVGSYLLATFSLDTLEIEIDKLISNDSTIDTSFYHLDSNSNQMFSIITINTKVIATPFGSNVDLTGVHLKSIDLTWEPHVKINDCNNLGEKCSIDGMSANIMNLLAEKLNFTWSSNIELNKTWGTFPIDGNLENGTYLGIYGSIIKKEYDLNLSPWTYRFHRFGHCDFIRTYDTHYSLSFAISNSQFDFKLFIRPFVQEVWYAIIGTVVICLIFLIITSYFKVEQSFRIATTVSFYFFILLNIYYGGAMTMFFTSTPTILFDSMHDILRAYPQWNIKLAQGNENYFKSLAEAGDELVGEYWTRMETSPEYYKYKSIGDGLNEIRSGQIAIFIEKIRLESYLNRNPQERNKQNLMIMPVVRRFAGMITAHNWPLTDIFRRNTQIMAEQGIFANIYAKWIGTVDSNEQSSSILSQTTFSFSQMSSAFFAYLIVLIASLLLLFIEITCKKPLINPATSATLAPQM